MKEGLFVWISFSKSGNQIEIQALIGFEMANETKWVRKVISGLFGMFGIVAMIGGLILTHRMMNLVRWRLWLVCYFLFSGSYGHLQIRKIFTIYLSSRLQNQLKLR